MRISQMWYTTKINKNVNQINKPCQIPEPPLYPKKQRQQKKT